MPDSLHSDAQIFDTQFERFDEEVIAASHRIPILVDFWAEWCPPCRMLTPVLEHAMQRYVGSLRLAKVEVDDGENMKLAGRYAMRGFPTVLLFVAGEIVGRFASAQSEHWVHDFIADHLDLDAVSG